MRFVRKVNELPPSSLSHSLNVQETARHTANEVHLLTKRGGLADTLKCAQESEVADTEGKFCTSARHARQSGITQQKPHMINLIPLYSDALFTVVQNNLQPFQLRENSDFSGLHS